MSDSQPSQPDRDRESQGISSLEDEVLDGVPVLVGAPRIITPRVAEGSRAVEHLPTGALPAVQAAAVAAGGFIAGAALVGLVRRRQRHALLLKGARPRRLLGGGSSSRKDRRAGELLQIVGSRSLLVDLHLLGTDR